MTGRTLSLLALAACNGRSTLTGTARDELRLQGLPDVLVIPGSPSERCPPVHLQPESSGRFSAQVCEGQEYTVSYSPGTHGIFWRGEPATARAGADVSISAWPAAEEPGVYILGDTMTRIGPSIALETSTVLPSNTVVRYPIEVPRTVPRVLPGQFLLLQGTESTDALTPVGTSTSTLSFARPVPPSDMGPWSFEGVDIGPDGVVTRLPTPTPMATRQTVADVDLAWIPADGVPAGRYLVGRPEGQRAWLVDVGPLPSP